MKEQECKDEKIKGFYFHIPQSHLSYDRYYDCGEDLRICVAEMIEQYKKERERK